MSRFFRSKIRLKAGGVMNFATGVMTGGVTVGHFAADYEASATRPVLTSAISNGPTVQETDPDGDTLTVRINAEQDSVAARNLAHYAALGGPVEITSADALDQRIIDRYGPFEFGDYGQSGSKESAKENTTLVGTNRKREAAWIADQEDMPGGSSESNGSGG
jgi:hypothetical protein